MSESVLIASTAKLNRQELAAVPTPPGTATHRPLPHVEVVETLVETLSFRHIGVVKEEYAVSKDGMKMFGMVDLDTGMPGCRFSIGVRNSHDRSMRLAAVVGVRVLVCENMAFSGDFQPVLAKHSKKLLSMQNALSIGVDQMQRNFDGMRKQVGAWRESQLSDTTAKLIIYHAFIESDLDVPKHLARSVHDLYFHPQHEEFQQRTMWSLSNAFTSAFKQLEPIPQFRATAKLAGFLEKA